MVFRADRFVSNGDKKIFSKGACLLARSAREFEMSLSCIRIVLEWLASFGGPDRKSIFGNIRIGIKQGILDFDYVRIGIKCQKAMMIV